MSSHRNFLAKVTRLLLTLPLAAATLPMAPSFAETGSPVYLAGLTFPPGSGSAPRRTAGAGVRGNCAPGLTALLPNHAVSKTTNENMEFSIYIPKTNALIGQFTLNLSADGSQSYSQEILLSSEQPGYFSFTIPKEIELAMDKPYDWRFTLYCDGGPGTGASTGNSERFTTVSGQIVRAEITPQLAADLRSATTPLAKAAAYAKAGIWHEAMAIVSELRDTDPGEWQSLLRSVDLGCAPALPGFQCEQRQAGR